jgi:hypothetical protein
MRIAHATENLTYHVFVNEWPQQTNGVLPNGEPKRFSPQASTLICGSENAVLTRSSGGDNMSREPFRQRSSGEPVIAVKKMSVTFRPFSATQSPSARA